MIKEPGKNDEGYATVCFTVRDGTMTEIGFVKHHVEGDVHMPVALEFPAKVGLADALQRFRPPKRHPLTGALMFVRPDGRLFCPSAS